ncbi:PAS domain S-box protein [Halobiforma nitratireducens]|uniref:Multi-sensor signal transduction histidine kinase n=1 Tax=Halobiforma nitratireducens JCM 10879 TaxID=1227454 RepID=M0M9G5_9EURY|nr:PAS domain S-box protein [Halobiforma nitratireducens]EMA41020.1 multi-sensor signal transduction histidine kinase [Halobiforma nitratireducens JCM 10879]
MPSLRVLYVDREPGLEPVRRYLEDGTDVAEFDVYTDADPKNALSRLDEADCLVCGVPLPGSGGADTGVDVDAGRASIAFLERVRTQDPSLPIVLFVDRGANVPVTEAFDAGATDYVRKPDARSEGNESERDRREARPVAPDCTGNGVADVTSPGPSAGPTGASVEDPGTTGTDASSDRSYELLARRIDAAVCRESEGGSRPGLEEVIERAPDAVFVTGADGTIEYANDAFERVTGFSAAEAIGKNPRILKSGEQDQEYYERMWSAILNGELWEEEVVNERKSGEYYHAHQTIAPLVDEDGTVERFVAVQRDVTDRRRLEREIERSARTLSRLHDAAFELDRPLEAKLEELLEIGTESLDFPMGYVTRIDGDTQQIVAAVGDHESLEKGATDPLERTYCRHTIEADDPVVVTDAESDADWADDPAVDRFGLSCYLGGKIVVDGEVFGTVCFADEESRDPYVGRVQRSTIEALAQWIGHELERRRYERDLERYEEIIENVPVGVFRTSADGDGGFQAVNEAMVELFDAPSKAALLERPVPDCYRDPDRHADLAEQLADSSEVRNAVVELETVDGEPFYGSVSAIERRDGNATERGFEFGLDGATDRATDGSEGEVTAGYVDGIIQDVTERERAKAELARSRERLQVLFDRSPDGIVVHDADGRILEVNATQLEQSGYDRDELLSMNVADLEASLSLPKLREVWADLEPGSVLKVEGEHVRADGSIYPVEVWVSCIELEDERRFLALSREISDRKERERELERREAFVENVSDAITVLDRDGTVEYASPAVETVVSCSPDVLVDGSLFEHVHPDDESAVESALERVLNGSGVETVEYRFRCRNCGDAADDTASPESGSASEEESWRWVESNVRNTLDDPTIEGLLVTTRDITARKERERKLDLARTQLRQVVDLVPDLLFAKNREGEYLLANEAVAAVYGRSVEEIVGKTDAELLQSAKEVSAFRADDREVIESGEPKHVPEETLTAADGNTLVLETTKIPFEVAGTGEPAVLGYSRDVTELKEQRDRLDLLNQVVRHDVRNDMQVVRGRLQLLADQLDGETLDMPTVETHLTEMLEATDEAIELTKTARDLTETMLERNADRKPIPLEDVLWSELEGVRSRYADARVELETPVPDVAVVADEMLESVVENLLVNAIVHNDGPTPRVTVSADADPEHGRVELRVADDGPGVPDDRKDEVFGKGEKGLDSPGTGLGLYLVSTLVEQYGGNVWLEDNDPKGTVVVVTLRIADSKRGQGGAGKSP